MGVTPRPSVQSPFKLFFMYILAMHTRSSPCWCSAVSQALALRKDQVKSTQSEIEEAEKSQLHPFPTELSLWTVDDVCRWLDTLQLGEYKQAFREGKVRFMAPQGCSYRSVKNGRRGWSINGDDNQNRERSACRPPSTGQAEGRTYIRAVLSRIKG